MDRGAGWAVAVFWGLTLLVAAEPLESPPVVPHGVDERGADDQALDPSGLAVAGRDDRVNPPTPLGCVLSEVENLMLAHSGGMIVMTWDVPPDPCLTGYEVVGSPTAGYDDFVCLDDNVTTPSYTFHPAIPQGYFIVAGTSGGNTGPWGTDSSGIERPLGGVCP